MENKWFRPESQDDDYMCKEIRDRLDLFLSRVLKDMQGRGHSDVACISVIAAVLCKEAEQGINALLEQGGSNKKATFLKLARELVEDMASDNSTFSDN